MQLFRIVFFFHVEFQWNLGLQDCDALTGNRSIPYQPASIFHHIIKGILLLFIKSLIIDDYL